MDAFAVAVEGLKSLEDLERLPADVTRAAYQSINKTIQRYYAVTGKDTRKQVAFPARYVTGARGRLQITGRATAKNLEGEITGRHRPTSLARFAKSRSPEQSIRQGGVMVEVSPGSPKWMERAFLIRLRAGAAGIETQSNLGLAIRLRPGETIQKKRVSVSKWRGLYLLYGPSIDQVFDDVAEERAPEMADFLEGEFDRLMELKNG